MPEPEFDLVVRNGNIADGSGGEIFEGDVAIRNGKIAALGKVAGFGADEISAKGELVTPGFIDLHTHYDGQVTWEHRLSPSSAHGVTTALMGNCGVGFAPCREQDRNTLVRVMEGVEDVPELVMAKGIPWAWESFSEYLDFLEARRYDIDCCALVAHAPIRIYVMGERGARRETASAAERAQMRAIVSAAIEAGAMGVSTSQNLGHRTVDGELAPTVGAADGELLALASGVADAGGGIYQLIPNAHYGADPVQEINLLKSISAVTGDLVTFSILQKKYQSSSVDIVLTELEKAAKEGHNLKGQIFPRPIGMLFGLDLSFHPFRFHPSFQAFVDAPLSEKVAAMRDPDFRRRLLSEKPSHTNSLYLSLLGDPGELYPFGDPPNYEPAKEDRLSEQAKRRGLTAAELAYDILLESEGRGLLMYPSSNYVDGSLDVVGAMIGHNETLVALGDGGAHYGLICDASFTTSMLTHWTRDRHEGRFSLPWVVSRLTARNAAAANLSDRGLLQVGKKADLNIIDYDRLTLHRPSVAYDLPGGGRRLKQKATGYVATIVNGEVTYRDGEMTGALPGRLMRRPSGSRRAPAGRS